MAKLIPVLILMLTLSVEALPSALPLGPPSSGTYVNPDTREMYYYSANPGTLSDMMTQAAGGAPSVETKGCTPAANDGTQGVGWPKSVSCREITPWGAPIYPCKYLPTNDWTSAANRPEPNGGWQCAAASLMDPSNLVWRVDAQLTNGHSSQPRYNMSIYFRGSTGYEPNSGWDWLIDGSDNSCGIASVSTFWVVQCAGLGNIPNPKFNTGFNHGPHPQATWACLRVRFYEGESIEAQTAMILDAMACGPI